MVVLSALSLLVCAIGLPAGSAAAAGQQDGPDILFNGKDTAGWKLRNANAETKETWKVVSDVKLDAGDARKLVGIGQGGGKDAVLFRQPIEHGSDLISEKEFGDCELHIEFMVPKGSNSGVYLMGRYEVQVLDSFGKPDNRLGMGDCGSIYSAAVAKSNATKAPGEWQTLEVVFKAPRFENGKKVEDALFVLVKLNGKTIHENVAVKGPTGGEIGREVPKGPLMLQGDHGIVAFRNIAVKPVDIRR